ncbi:MAG: hypothetical protein KA155_10265 [Alphaproteobacteria bacterium]|jgi:hypothetical protein|nr:hypothetical protein [Alphaproteobacteria bacterium]
MNEQTTEIPYYSQTLTRQEALCRLEEKMREYGFGDSSTQKITGRVSESAFIWAKTGEKLGQKFNVVVRIDPRKELFAIDTDIRYLAEIFQAESDIDFLGNGRHMRVFMGGASPTSIYIHPQFSSTEP